MRSQAPWPVFSLAWSARQGKQNEFRLAVGSFVEEYANKVHVRNCTCVHLIVCLLVCLCVGGALRADSELCEGPCADRAARRGEERDGSARAVRPPVRARGPICIPPVGARVRRCVRVCHSHRYPTTKIMWMPASGSAAGKRVRGRVAAGSGRGVPACGQRPWCSYLRGSRHVTGGAAARCAALWRPAPGVLSCVDVGLTARAITPRRTSWPRRGITCGCGLCRSPGR